MRGDEVHSRAPRAGGSAELLPGLVSVVTIFRDPGPFLTESVDSVLAQQYPSWELLLVDDGSVDGSDEVAQAYAAQLPERIRYLGHPGGASRGKSTSRNLGIAAARGEYLALLDADDVFLPDKLQRQVSVLREQPRVAMVYGPTRYWYGWTGRPEDGERDFLSRLGVRPHAEYPPPRLLTTYLRDPGVVPCTCGLLLRTAVVRRLGGFDRSIEHLFEDQVLLAKICLEEWVYVEGRHGDLYRQHDGSSSARAIAAGEYHPSRANPAHETYLRWLADYLDSRGVDDASLRRALRRASMCYRRPVLGRALNAVHRVAGVAARLRPAPREQQRPAGSVDLG
jgi:glycosyltransferase involved in cell wall biosynthesis